MHAVSPAPAGQAGALISPEQVTGWLDSLDAPALCSLAGMVQERLVPRFAAAVLAGLRTAAAKVVLAGETDSTAPIVRLRLEATDYENGVFWDEYGVEALHSDGAVSILNCTEGEVPTRLADLSSVDCPLLGDILTVDLLTGDMEQE
ncbi:hypothetical protein [Streptomyces nanshensis]|uniref:Uncharacterized protein n=1 Tax=Streptomyces nanshensis TaxID=518642 RepID=A0A1E7KZG8_9ACTN|nr:hypothetical protein [Streptomyces nanshensis]OEV09326.1 hypothetical protein AN218_23140 [Streptomyces nanshensis]